MAKFICVTCGTQFAESTSPPDGCAICEEPRQYVPPSGQKWTSLEEMWTTHRNAFRRYEPGLYGIGTVPHFAIGQRALLLRGEQGNVLWDCISFLDEATVDLIAGLGGLRAIAISHPHYYTSMVDWSVAFGGAPIYLHEADRAFVMRPDKAIKFWSGEGHDLEAGLRLIRVGGHFEGSTVLAWAQGASGAGALLTGDSLAVTPGGDRVSALRSLPNQVPLRPSAIRRMWKSLEPYRFDRLYGAFWESVVQHHAKAVVEHSLQAYAAAATDAECCKDR
jgi:hypothetical protein